MPLTTVSINFYNLYLPLQYISVEEPVRRKVNTSLIAGASIKGQNQLSHMSGLILFPEEVEFGVLREGYTYCYTVYLKNTGVDSCRFRIKQPPPATGLRINYKPGPVRCLSVIFIPVEVFLVDIIILRFLFSHQKCRP